MTRPLYRTPAEGLRAVTDPVAFEHVAHYALRDDYPDLELTSPSKDDGIDLYSRRLGSLRDDVRGMVSLQASWTSKLDAELDTIEGLPEDRRPRVAVFVTVKNAQEAHIRPRIERAAALGVTLLVRGFTQLLTRLEQPGSRWIAELELGVEPLRPKMLLGVAQFTELTAGLVPGFEAELVGRDAEVDTLREALWADGADAPRVVLVEGPGGIGKTRLAVEASRDFTTLVAPTASAVTTHAIEGIPGDSRAVLIVDDAHRCVDLSGLTAMLHDRAFAQTKVVLVIRPGMAGEVLAKAGLERFPAVSVPVGPLPREEMASMISRTGIDDDLFITQVIEMARGVPLIAHAMCETALAKGRFDGRDVVDVFNARLAVRLHQDDDAGRAAALALALASSANSAEDLEPLRGVVTGLPGPEDISRCLERLSDVGVAQATTSGDGHGGVRYTYSIKPDLLAATVVASGLGTGRGVRVDLDRYLSAIGLGPVGRRRSAREAADTQVDTEVDTETDAGGGDPGAVGSRSRRTLAHLDRASLTHEVALLANAAAIAERPALTGLLMKRIFDHIPSRPSAGDWVAVFRLLEQLAPYSADVFARLRSALVRSWPPTDDVEVFWFETASQVSEYQYSQLSSAASGLIGRHGHREPGDAIRFALTTALFVDDRSGTRSREDLGRAVAGVAGPHEHERWSAVWQRRSEVASAIGAWVDEEVERLPDTGPVTADHLRRILRLALVALMPLLNPVVERSRMGSPEAADVIVMTGGHLPAGPETVASVEEAATLVASLIDRFPVDSAPGDAVGVAAGDDLLRPFTVLPRELWAIGARGAPRADSSLPTMLREALASASTRIESAFAARWDEWPLWVRFEVSASVLRVRPHRSLKQKARQGSPVALTASHDDELATLMVLVPPVDDPYPGGASAEELERQVAAAARRTARRSKATRRLADSVTVAGGVDVLRVVARIERPWAEHDPAQHFARALATRIADEAEGATLLDAAFGDTPPAYAALMVSVLIDRHTDLVSARLAEHAQRVGSLGSVLDVIPQLADTGHQRALTEATLDTIVAAGRAMTEADEGVATAGASTGTGFRIDVTTGVRKIGAAVAQVSGAALTAATSLAPMPLRDAAAGGMRRIGRLLPMVPAVQGASGDRPHEGLESAPSSEGLPTEIPGDDTERQLAPYARLEAAADAWVLTTYRIGVNDPTTATGDVDGDGDGEVDGAATTWHLDALIRMGIDGPPSVIGAVLQRVTQQRRHARRTRETGPGLELSADHVAGLLAVLDRALRIDEEVNLFGFLDSWNHAAGVAMLARLAPDELAATLAPWLMSADGRARRWPPEWERSFSEMDPVERLPFGQALKARLDTLMESTEFDEPVVREEAQFYLDRDVDVLLRDSDAWEDLVSTWIGGRAPDHARAAAVLSKSWRSASWSPLVDRLLAVDPDKTVIDRLIDGMIPMGFGPDIAEDIGLRLDAVKKVGTQDAHGAGFVEQATTRLQQVIDDYRDDARRSRAGY